MLCLVFMGNTYNQKKKEKRWRWQYECGAPLYHHYYFQALPNLPVELARFKKLGGLQNPREAQDNVI